MTIGLERVAKSGFQAVRLVWFRKEIFDRDQQRWVAQKLELTVYQVRELVSCLQAILSRWRQLLSRCSASG